MIKKIFKTLFQTLVVFIFLAFFFVIYSLVLYAVDTHFGTRGALILTGAMAFMIIFGLVYAINFVKD